MSILNHTSSLVGTRSERIGLTVVAISHKGQSTFAPPAVLRLAVEAHLFSENPVLGLKASTKKRFNALWAGSSEELSARARICRSLKRSVFWKPLASKMRLTASCCVLLF